MSLTKKITASAFALALSLAIMPTAFAQTPANCDADGDGYISLNVNGIDVIIGDFFRHDGNYGAAEWSNFFNTFKDDSAGVTLCSALNFKKGAEPTRCDKPIVDQNSGVFDPSKVDSVSGGKVYPGAFDNPGNGIDEDCNGEDGKLIEGGGDMEKDLSGLTDRSIVTLSRIVIAVSIIFLLWGGILYSSAAGDENKTRKAKKAMIGAIIGLVVGLLAPTIVTFIASLI